MNGSATPDTTGNFSGDSGDEYEENVRQRRAENAALLASLELQSGSAVLDPQGAQDRKRNAEAEARRKKRLSEANKKAADERKKRRKIEEAQPRPARTSARLKGRTPAGLEEENKRIEEEAKELEEQRRLAQQVLHENHNLLALLGPDETAGESDGEEEDGTERPPGRQTNTDRAKVLQDTLTDILADDSDDRKYAGETKHDDEFAALQATFKNMELLSTNKVTPKRIYTAAFHPSTRRDVVFTGDKNGYISVWEPLAKNDHADGDADEDDDSGVTGADGITYNLRIPHDSSPISCIKIPPTQPNKLFSSSYNSTLRRIDLEKGVSEEVFAFGGAGDDDYDEALLSVFDFQRDVNVAGSDSADDAINSNVLWCGDHRGGVIRVDLREPASGAKPRSKRGNRSTNWERWQVCEKKIGGLSLNPASPHALSVASLDQSIHIFDIRRLQALPSSTSIPNNYKNVSQDLLEQVQGDIATTKDGAQLGYNASKQASTSVDWSPDGNRLASVSYEDVVRVWDINRSWLDVNGSSNTPSTKSSSKSKSNGLMRYVKREAPSSPIEEPTLSGGSRPSDILSRPTIIPHNNQTGKWLTLFRVRFSPLLSQPNHFTIGNMRRQCEIWYAGGGSSKSPPKIVKELFDPEWTSAVQAVSTFHPRREARVVSGNASGRCLLWGLKDE